MGDRLAKDKLLRLKHMVDGCEQFLVEGLVLALEVEHGDGHWRGLGGLGGIPGRDWAVLHADILPTMEPIVCRGAWLEIGREIC